MDGASRRVTEMANSDHHSRECTVAFRDTVIVCVNFSSVNFIFISFSTAFSSTILQQLRVGAQFKSLCENARMFEGEWNIVVLDDEDGRKYR